jgi:hypothetical protein
MDIPANVLAMIQEVAGLVLDDWALERGYTFAPGIRDAAVASMASTMAKAAGDNQAAVASLAPMPRDVLRRHIRALTEHALIRALDHGAESFSEGAC